MQELIEKLLTEISFKTSRSGGAGGQNVNKVATKVELNFNVNQSEFLSEEQKIRISDKLASKITKDGILQIISQTERSQLGNKRVVLEKFKDLILSCFKIVKARKPTIISKGVKERRLLAKKRCAEIKKNRSKIIM